MQSGKALKQYYYGEIERLSKRFAVSWLCQLFEISRSGYYKWKSRKGQLNRYEKVHADLDRYVAALHKTHPSSGYRALNARLRAETGWITSDISILHSMQRLSVKAKLQRLHSGRRQQGEEHKTFPNVLNRDFSATCPLSKVVTDITHFEYRGVQYSFVCYLDLFNNEILEWNVRTDETMALILPPLRRLLKRKKMSTESQLLLHSDQGSQYSSAGYTSLLKEYNVVQSMSRAGTPRDNAVMESVFGWFKEFLYADFFPGAAIPIQHLLALAVFEFNHFRPACSLHYKSPVQFKIEQGFC